MVQSRRGLLLGSFVVRLAARTGRGALQGSRSLGIHRKRLPVVAVDRDGRGRERHLGLGDHLQPEHEHVHDLRDVQRSRLASSSPPRPEGPYTAVPGGLWRRVTIRAFRRRRRTGVPVSSTGKIAELAQDGKTVVNPSVSSYAGWNEGPELFKRAPYYYVTWSSNGTERGANGIVNSVRSMSLAGPWEPDPTNPVMRNLNNGTRPDHPFEGPQHSELIRPRTASGSSVFTPGNRATARWPGTCASSPSSGRTTAGGAPRTAGSRTSPTTDRTCPTRRTDSAQRRLLVGDAGAACSSISPDWSGGSWSLSTIRASCGSRPETTTSMALAAYKGTLSSESI